MQASKNCGVFIVVLLLTLVLGLVQADQCPDHKTKCSKTQTCCSDKHGGYGCCPYPQAFCCADGRHCCPHGSKCDIAHSRCVPNSEVSSQPEWWTMIYNSFTREEWLAQNLADEDIHDSGHNTTMFNKKICGGGEQTCPDKYTCCALATGGWGCCPFEGATCCQDKIHCCPSGKSCDDQGKRCV